MIQVLGVDQVHTPAAAELGELILDFLQSNQARTVVRVVLDKEI